MPHSHHSHSGQFCKHAEGLLEETVVEAICQGFEVYGLTEHVPRYRMKDLYPEEEGMSVEALKDQFHEFLDEAHRLKAKYASKISLLVGLETEFITRADLDELQNLLDQYGSHIEYIVGSVHHVNGIPIDFDIPTCRRALNSLSVSSGSENETELREAFFCYYFDAQYAILQRFQPEIIGHFDLCRLYNPSLSFSDYPKVWNKIERNIRYATDYGALFEMNAAAFRKGWDTAYPARDVVEVILRHGGRFALSDDSHGPHAVGLHYDRMSEYLRTMNIKELWYLKSSDTANSAGRNLRPSRLDGNWHTHTYWQKDSCIKLNR